MGADEQSEKGLIYFLASAILTFPMFGVAQAPVRVPDGINRTPLEFCIEQCPGILPERLIVESGQIYVLSGDGGDPVLPEDVYSGSTRGAKHAYHKLLPD